MLPYRDGFPVILSVKPRPSKINKRNADLKYAPGRFSSVEVHAPNIEGCAGSKGGDGVITFKFFAQYPDMRNSFSVLAEALKALNINAGLEHLE